MKHVLVLIAIFAAITASAVELCLSLPLARTAYGCNERISISVLR